MFKKLIQNLRSGERKPAAFDPSCFGDPIAMRTGWTPAKSGGTHFRTHKLVAVDADRLEFQLATQAKVFFLPFLLIGIGVPLISLYSKISSGSLEFDLEAIGLLVFTAVFLLLGMWVFLFFSKPIVFDKRKGLFWKGRREPDRAVVKNPQHKFAELNSIHALQLLSERCEGEDSTYLSYELNIVLDNGERINVIDHGNQDKLREDAQAVSAFLGKPVWDAT